MNWLDVVVVVLVLGLGIMGWLQGVIRLGFTFAGGILAVALAGLFFDDLAPAIPISNDGAAELAAFGGIIVVVLVLALIAAGALKAMLKAALLGWVDNSAGAFVGALLGALAGTAFVSAAGVVPSDSARRAVEESLLAKPLVDTFGFVLALLPEEFERVKSMLSDRAFSAVAELHRSNL